MAATTKSGKIIPDLKDDERLRDIIVKVDQDELPSFQHDDTSKIGIGIVGFPFDEGNLRNRGGRAGGKDGPSVFRYYLNKIGCHPNPEWNIRLSNNMIIYDFGDIDDELNYDESHLKLSIIVEQLLEKKLIPFIIGGSNDQSYFNFVAFTNYLNKRNNLSDNFGVINIDAHFDVRPKQNNLEHNGSPFRMMLESSIYQNNNGFFTEFACQGHQCSMKHYNFLKSAQNTKVYWLDKDLRKNEKLKQGTVAEQFEKCLDELIGNKKENGRKLFVSFDVDSIRQSDCPGVSCPSPIGLTAIEAGRICFISGVNKNVMLMDMSEFNPHAESGTTGRLLSWMFYNFVLGVSTRRKSLRSHL